jgi:putative tryptophan/tyrosine transport system substrate-binding protein
MRLIGLFLSLALTLTSIPVEAQQPAKVYRIGTLSDGPDPASGPLMDAMRDLGWVEGQNFKIEKRKANAREQLPALAAELVRLKVDLIFTFGTLAALAARDATKTIPIVFRLGDDPVASGLVASFGRPGGNLTGFALGLYDDKLVEVLKEAVPRVSRVAYPLPADPPPTSENRRQDRLTAAARTLGLELRRIEIQSGRFRPLLRCREAPGRRRRAGAEYRVVSPSPGRYRRRRSPESPAGDRLRQPVRGVGRIALLWTSIV